MPFHVEKEVEMGINIQGNPLWGCILTISALPLGSDATVNVHK